MAVVTEELMLTTVDNPFSPHHSFESWHMWDTAKGYNTLSLVARLAQTSDEPGAFDDGEIEAAMTRIVEDKLLADYVLVDSGQWDALNGAGVFGAGSVTSEPETDTSPAPIPSPEEQT